MPLSEPDEKKPSLRKRKPPRKSLENLSVVELELALQYLCLPQSLPPPEPLKSLNDLEWFVLEKLLEKLVEQRDQSPLH